MGFQSKLMASESSPFRILAIEMFDQLQVIRFPDFHGAEGPGVDRHPRTVGKREMQIGKAD
jgi:hypothetical protein